MCQLSRLTRSATCKHGSYLQDRLHDPVDYKPDIFANAGGTVKKYSFRNFFVHFMRAQEIILS